MNVASYGKRIEENLSGLGQICLLARDAVASLFRWKTRWSELLYQLYFIGVTSQAVVLITGAFTGMV
ncbi:MAG: ABC transporter permease, partial [Limisphaerales bacterium]